MSLLSSSTSICFLSSPFVQVSPLNKYHRHKITHLLFQVCQGESEVVVARHLLLNTILSVCQLAHCIQQAAFQAKSHLLFIHLIISVDPIHYRTFNFTFIFVVLNAVIILDLTASHSFSVFSASLDSIRASSLWGHFHQ